MAPRLHILSPKRNTRLQTGREGFFPYYAGFPEIFALEQLKSAKPPRGAVILDPWNGSGAHRHSAVAVALCYGPRVYDLSW